MVLGSYAGRQRPPGRMQICVHQKILGSQAGLVKAGRSSRDTHQPARIHLCWSLAATARARD